MILYQLILSHLTFDYGKALTPEMIKAKAKGYPYIPIAKHAMLHAIGVFIILMFNSISIEKAILASSFEFTTHFCIDVAKGRIETKWPKLKDNTNPYHWHLFQVDQALHITSKFLIYLFV
jgi:hypothetical protein